GRVVRRSDAVKAAERSAKDFGFSSLPTDPPVTAGANLLPGDLDPSVVPCAFALIAARSTLPTGWYAPFTGSGRSATACPASRACRLISAISTLPTGRYSPFTTSPEGAGAAGRAWNEDSVFCDFSSCIFT